MQSLSSADRPRCAKSSIVFLLGLCSLPAVADDGLQAGQQALHLQQQQQRDLQQLQLEQRQRQLRRGSPDTPPPSAAALPGETVKDGHCWPLRGTRVGGVTLFSKTELDKRIEPYMAPCMDAAQINRLLA